MKNVTNFHRKVYEKLVWIQCLNYACIAQGGQFSEITKDPLLACYQW